MTFHRPRPGATTVDAVETKTYDLRLLDHYTRVMDARAEERALLAAARAEGIGQAKTVLRWFFAACSAGILTAALVRWLTDWHGVWVFAAAMAAVVVVLAVGVRVLTPPDPDSPGAAGAESPAPGEPTKHTATTPGETP